MIKYDCLIIDAVNLAYKTFNYKKEVPTNISKKPVYKEAICNFIRCVEHLKNKYLHFDGHIFLLFDNYFSRADLQSSFMYADRKDLYEAYKKNRKKESKEFYNSLNLIRYYYMIGHPAYHTCRVDGLEADDLVKPILETFCKNKKNLMVTNDLDWCRYLNDDNHWLPNLSEEPEDASLLELKLNFPINEKNIVCYKAIFGDTSDNIPSLGRITSKIKSEFFGIIKDINYPEDLILKARANKDHLDILTLINDNERQYIINLQLVSTLPCANEYIISSCTTGRNDETLRNSIRVALGLSEVKSKFKFGNIKRPRV